MRIKFHGLNFRVFGWGENSWGINFRGHSSVVGTIAVGMGCHEIHENLYTTEFNTRMVQQHG